MQGSIYATTKCTCGGLYKYNLNGALVCSCGNEWKLNCYVRFGRAHTKRFSTVEKAERHLNFLRVQTDKGQFDQREWAKTQPLSFLSLRKKFLNHKKKIGIGVKQIRHITCVLNKAGELWDSTQIKDISEPDIEDFFDDMNASGKTKKNYQIVLHDFWTWVVRRERHRSKIEMLLFPDIRFKLAWRNIVSMDDQRSILDEIKRLTYDTNPRIWLGIKLLSMYPKVRPGELMDVREGHINLKENWILFPDPKEGIPKFIHLLPEHTDMIREVRGPKGLPDLYFFRHIKNSSGVKAGTRFGQKQFRKWWNKACENLGIKNVDLYGGTKHSTVTALGKILTPEQIQRGATGHVSDAFKRYMLPDINEAIQATRAVQQIQGDQHLINISEAKKSAK